MKIAFPQECLDSITSFGSNFNIVFSVKFFQHVFVPFSWFLLVFFSFLLGFFSLFVLWVEEFSKAKIFLNKT